MFFREKRATGHRYLQVVENRRENGKSRQRVVATLGRLDELERSGQLAALLESGARFCDAVLVLNAHRRGDAVTAASVRVGAPLVFERLWAETGCGPVLQSLLRRREFTSPIERAVFLTVLHRLVAPGSDRAAAEWRSAYKVRGADELDLHHAYRAMAWLGEPLPEQEQVGRTPFAPRCIKDKVEEQLFAARRELFSSLDLVFFDTTSIYFEGAGGQTIGRRGKSKDHRPDLPQMVVGLVLDQQGRPLCCELWPGNTADVSTLVPIVERLRRRFGIGRVCIVADRGMISEATITAIEQRGWAYILGARMRSWREVRDEVLSRPGRYHEVVAPRGNAKDPSPLKVKQVRVGEHRYVVCFNIDQARKDAADREAIVAGLEQQLHRGDRSLIGNKGYRRFVATDGIGFTIDDAKVRSEARYDGKWVLRTNTEWSATDVALRYKQLWMVEDLFRQSKSLLETRPIWHKRDETIRGHVFCSFLALVLRKELLDRLKAAGHGDVEWADVIRDLDRLEETEIDHQGRRFIVRTEVTGVAGIACKAAGVALPPTLRPVIATPPTEEPCV
jgi:hypothetical protein